METSDETRPACAECGEPMHPQTDCEQCYGEDEYGYGWFCPKDDFCCGC